MGDRGWGRAYKKSFFWLFLTPNSALLTPHSNLNYRKVKLSYLTKLPLFPIPHPLSSVRVVRIRG
jgi:hypothetical protein